MVVTSHCYRQRHLRSEMPELAERQTAEPAGTWRKEVPEGGLNPHELALIRRTSATLRSRSVIQNRSVSVDPWPPVCMAAELTWAATTGGSREEVGDDFAAYAAAGGERLVLAAAAGPAWMRQCQLLADAAALAG
jgi:hypothetical protein